MSNIQNARTLAVSIGAVIFVIAVFVWINKKGKR